MSAQEHEEIKTEQKEYYVWDVFHMNESYHFLDVLATQAFKVVS